MGMCGLGVGTCGRGPECRTGLSMAGGSGSSMYRVAATRHCGWACMSRGWGHVNSFKVEMKKGEATSVVTVWVRARRGKMRVVGHGDRVTG